MRVRARAQVIIPGSFDGVKGGVNWEPRVLDNDWIIRASEWMNIPVKLFRDEKVTAHD